MASIKLKFRASKDTSKSGCLYYQIILNRVVRQAATNYHIYSTEWNDKTESLNLSTCSENRKESLRLICDRVKWEIRRFHWVERQMEGRNENYNTDDLIEEFCNAIKQNRTVMEYMYETSVRLKKLGKIRSSENCRTTLNSFMRFRKDEDLSFDRMDKELMEEYETYLKGSGLKRNTTSFYFRILRMIYNKAVEDGLTEQNSIFKKVYTGIDKTIKRAIPMEAIKRIKELELDNYRNMDYARDMFMMSFYLRGMSFIDMAYLRKKDLKNGMLVYSRRKTGQELSIKWENKMQELLDKYPENPTQYLLPIIAEENGEERKQYKKKMANVNNGLKKVGSEANLDLPLTMYVARHSWASIARGKNISLSVISEGMGHGSEVTTQIYLNSIQTSLVDNANHKILKDL